MKLGLNAWCHLLDVYAEQYIKTGRKQGKSEGFDSCDWPGIFT